VLHWKLADVDQWVTHLACQRSVEVAPGQDTHVDQHFTQRLNGFAAGLLGQGFFKVLLVDKSKAG
jgi:hypothetical protein